MNAAAHASSVLEEAEQQSEELGHSHERIALDTVQAGMGLVCLIQDGRGGGEG
jgi:hypothetical protein